MRIFIDTEFTSFSNPRLISIGAITDDDRSFYGVVTDFSRQSCTAFVAEHVLPLLAARPRDGEAPYSQVAQAFCEWVHGVSGAGVEATIVADDEYDLELAHQLMAGASAAVGRNSFRFQRFPVNGRPAAEQHFQMYFKANPERRRHNALDDALGLRHVVNCIDSGKNR